MSAADLEPATGQKTNQEQSIQAMLALNQTQMATHFSAFGSVLNKVKDDVMQIKADQELLKQQVHDLTSSKADSHQDPFQSTPATKMRASASGSNASSTTSTSLHCCSPRPASSELSQ